MEPNHSDNLNRFSIAARGVTASAMFAAVLLWLADSAIMVRLGQHPPGGLYLPFSLAILLFAGLLIVMVEWLVVKVSFMCANALCSSRGTAFGLTCGIFIGFFLTPGMLLLSTRLFSGVGISRWRWAPYGPWIVFSLSFILVVLVTWLCVFFRERWEGLRKRMILCERASIASVLAVVIVLIILGNLYLYPELYEYLHLTAALMLFVSCQLLFVVAAPVLRGMWGRRISWGRALFLPAIMLIVVVQFLVFSRFLSSNRERVFAWQQPYYHRKAVRVLRWLWDLDRDGFSPVLGGGDPCDWDPDEVPFAVSMGVVGERRPSGAEPARDESLQGDIKKLVRRTSHYNILLITVDALRADRLTDSGTAQRVVPQIDELKNRSVFFTRCFAPSSYTVVSMGGMLFSRICPWSENRSRPSVTERLREAGYSAVRVVNPAMRRGKRLSYLARGFESEVFAGHNRWGREWAGRLMDGALREAVAGVIRRLRGKKFFIWVHFEDPHEWPYVSASVFPGPMGAREKYDYILRRTDEEVGRLLSALGENGIADRTVVLLTSDHGQGLGEHNIMTHTQYLYHSLIHVPLTIYVPGVEARRVDQNVSLMDVDPTLLELAGLPCGPHAEGISLVPCLVGGSIPGNRPIISIEARQRSVIKGPWKLIVTPEAVAVELFNIDLDSEERNNLSHDEELKTIKEELWEELEPYWQIKVKGPLR